MRTTIVALCRLIVCVAILHVCALPASAQNEPLHSLIDKLLVPAGEVTPALASDAEFLRRASLDIIGMPPTADEARAFLADTASNKRTLLIDNLFASSHFVRHLAQMLDLMLMERRPNTNVPADEWEAWLVKSVRENKPWNVLAKEMLLADGDTAATRAPARFALDRGSDPNMLTRDIGRIFFGRDMQCAQCHDHPLVNSYLQSDYQGLYAFLQPTYTITRKEGDKQTVFQAEHIGNSVAFQSVFLHVPRRTAPRVPGGVMIDEPLHFPGEDYQVAPADNVRSIPKFSYRQQLADSATNGTNLAFNRNIANRLWALMFGRGLVHPPDMHNPDNPPSNPALLQLLADQIAVMKFDMRAFLRELALTNAYHRSFDPPAELTVAPDATAKEITGDEAERGALALASKESVDTYAKAAEAWEQIESTTIPVSAELDKAKTQSTDARKKVDEAAKAAAEAKLQVDAKKTVATPVQQAATAAQQAVKALPADKELADAAQKIVARAQQLSTEMATLAKIAEEKTAAVAPVTDAWNKTKPAVEAAWQKATPLNTQLKQAETAMLAARQKAEREKERLAALERRLATVRKTVQAAELNRAFIAASQAVATQQDAVTAAQKRLEEYAPIAAAQETAAKVHADTAAAAAKSLEAIRTEHAKKVEIANAIAAACQTLESARDKSPTNASLVAAAKLRSSADGAHAEVAEAQKKVEAATVARQAADQAVVAAQEALAGVLAERARREKSAAAAIDALTAAKHEFTAKQSALSTARSELSERWSNDFTIATLKPLMPEQLCWSVFRVTGVYDRYWQTEVADLDKTKPLTDEQKKDAAQVSARVAELEQRTYDKLKGNIGTFVSYYGAAGGQPQGDFFATADQALFAANAGPMNSWVAPAGGNVTERIIKQADANAAAEDLYLAVLTRLPTDAERAEVAKYLNDRAKDKPAAAQELVWALLTSAEFRFNH